MNCDHKFCRECLLSDWKQKIESGLINEQQLICPLENCSVPIDYHILKSNLQKNLSEKYEALLLNYALYNNPKILEKIVTCPMKICLNVSFISKEAQYFTCIACKETYCAYEGCLGVWKDHKGINCKEFRRKKLEISENEQYFEKYAKELKLMRCPVCGVFVEKTGNCNYVKCCSNKCQKKTGFCYLCGEILNEKIRDSHYLGNSAFSKCKKIGEKLLEKEKEMEEQEKCQHQILSQGNNEDDYYCENCQKKC